MGQSASDIIQVTVSQQTVALLLPGFGTPLVLSYHTHYTDRVRYYAPNPTGLAAMVTDGFSTTEAAYLAVAAIAAQSPAPPLVGVGRLANAPTQKFTYTPPGAASGAGQVYAFLIAGQLVSYTSVGADSVATIVAGLQTAYNALVSGPALTATIPGNANLTLTANVAGAFFATQIVDQFSKPSPQGRTNLRLAQTHADPGVAADLTAIQAFDNGWYGVINPWDSLSMATAVAAYVQSNLKLYVVNSLDGDVADASKTLDIASVAKTNADNRVAVLYKTENGSFAQAAWMGAKFPLPPGSENWAYQTLAGVPADTLSESEISAVCGVPTAGTQGKHASVYSTIFGVNVTEFGQVGSGSWLDITRGIDALVVDMGSRVFTLLSGPNKVPYTDKGVTQVQAQVQASLAFFQAPPQNFLDPAVAPVVTVPKVSTLSGSQIASRVLPNVNWTADVAGAINATTIQGILIPG